jgi:ligand-binding sensor domain-containing protein
MFIATELLMKQSLIILLIFIITFIPPSAFAVSIEGALLMLDDKTPHVACVVQAVTPAHDGKLELTVVATTLSDENGKYQFTNLLPERYQVRCYTLNGYVYYQAGKKLQLRRGQSLTNIDFRIAPFKKGTWKTITELDGLNGQNIQDIYRDPEGYMWFAAEGVSRYDGQDFLTFTTDDGLAENIVTRIYRDTEGDMWFATWGGVSRYDGKTFVTFTTQDGLPSNLIFDIKQSADGTMWFGCRGSISRYDGRRFQNFTSEDGVSVGWLNGIQCGSDGTMWFATEPITRYDGKKLQPLIEEYGFPEIKNIIALHLDATGNFWIGTWYNGVYRYDGKRFINFTTADGLVSNAVGVIYSEPDGTLWFGTSYWELPGAGVSRYDGEGFVNYTTADGLAHNYVRDIYRAPNGILWFTTAGGVSRYDETGMMNLTAADGLADNDVRTIYRDADGSMWFGTNAGGVSRYDGKEFINITTADGLADNAVWTINQTPDGALWFGTRWRGVSRYDGKAFTNITTADGLPHNFIFSSYGEPDGTLWFGTGEGVSRYDGKGFSSLTKEDGLAGSFIFAIHRDSKGMMWFGSSTDGLFRYDGMTIEHFTTANGLAGNSVFAIHSDEDGVIWILTTGGVSRYDGKGFTTFSFEDEKVYNRSRAVCVSDGIMWFNVGLRTLVGYDGVARTELDVRDGLAGKVRDIIQDADGSLWVAATGGITHYRRDTSPPQVRIVSVKLDREYTDFANLPSIIAGDRVTIRYRAIDYKTVPEKRQYRIRIKELDSDWRKPTKDNVFDDVFDKPGTYTFAVQAIDRDLNYSEPATLTLQVKRPWWMFALFGTIGVSIPLIGVGFYFGKRLQTQRAIAQQFNPYIAGRVVGEELFYGRNDLITDIERTLHNNCFLLYGERRIGKTSLQHQLRERLQNADDPTYRFIPAYIDLQGVTEDDFFKTIATGIVEGAASLFEGGRETLALRVDEERERYTYRDLNRDLRTILDHLKEGETKTIKLVLLMDEIDTLNDYSLRTNLNLRGLFMGQLKENLVLVMSGLYLKMDWSDEGGGSPPFNFLSREIQIQPLNEDDARKLITEPVKGFYTYEPKAIDLIIELSELRPFTIQGFCLRAVNRVLADGRTKITVDDIEAIKDSVLAEVLSIRGERAGTSLPASLNEALALLSEAQSRIADLEAEN